MKNSLTDLIEKPMDKIKSHSAKVYERYNELFKSIRRLAIPPKDKSKKRGKG